MAPTPGNAESSSPSAASHALFVTIDSHRVTRFCCSWNCRELAPGRAGGAQCRPRPLCKLGSLVPCSWGAEGGQAVAGPQAISRTTQAGGMLFPAVREAPALVWVLWQGAGWLGRQRGQTLCSSIMSDKGLELWVQLRAGLGGSQVWLADPCSTDLSLTERRRSTHRQGWPEAAIRPRAK